MPAARNEPQRAVLGPTLWMVVSGALHAATFFALGAVPLDTPRALDDIVEVSLVEEPAPAAQPPAQEPAPEPPVPEAPAPPPKPALRPAAKAPKEPPKPSNEPPAAAKEEIADFSGTTLSGQGGWTSAVGNNAAMDRPIGSPDALATGRKRDGVAGGVVGGTGVRVVPESDLSRRPTPPDNAVLNAALERCYPKTARQQGIEGVSRIRVRVLASGKLQSLATLSETYPGFADACRCSLRDIVFQPGLDRTAQPVAADIAYTCRFTVE